MRSHRWIVVAALLAFPTQTTAQTEPGPYAPIAILRPHDGHTADFEAGYIRHLEWHKNVGDKWVWYGWSAWASD